MAWRRASRALGHPSFSSSGGWGARAGAGVFFPGFPPAPAVALHPNPRCHTRASADPELQRGSCNAAAAAVCCCPCPRGPPIRPRDLRTNPRDMACHCDSKQQRDIPHAEWKSAGPGGSAYPSTTLIFPLFAQNPKVLCVHTMPYLGNYK